MTTGVAGLRTGFPPFPSAAIVMLDDIRAISPVESVKLSVNVDVPASFGVPVMAPDEAFRVRPEGSAPATVQV